MGFAERNIQYVTSSSEFTTPGGVIHGHSPTDCLGGDLTTFWLSAGNSTPDSPYAVEYIEFSVGEIVNLIGIYPWGGNYDLYISIFEGGVWRGNDTVPYDSLGSGYVGDYAPDVLYVLKGSIGIETPALFYLPRDMGASRIRLSFSHLTRTDWGPKHYRAGVREVIAGYSEGIAKQQGQMAIGDQNKP